MLPHKVRCKIEIKTNYLFMVCLLLTATNNDLVTATRYNHVKHHTSVTSSSSISNNNINTNNNDVYAIADSQAMTDDYMAQFSNNNNQQNTILPNILNGENTLIVNHYEQQQSLSSCQTVCACKWKGGKQTVECIDRLLIQIPEHIDPSTQVLDMSGNKLQTLSNEQFIRANLLNLQKLYLRNCKIGEIEPETFKGLTNLVELDLSHNLLVVVPALALSYISSLRELTLALNHIHKIESKAFASTPALQKLDLSHCDIQTIAPQAFLGLEGLTQLRLNGNKLSELLPKTIETLSRLHGIELHDNPWLCDCRLRDAKLWLLEKNIPYPVPPICAGGPERVLDRSFADLQIDDFACRPEMLPISHYVDATMGENASIVCRAKSIPVASIHWYWNGRLLVNNSAFSAYQRVHMYEEILQQFEKRSRLILTNAQETDSSEFYCVAENKAGTAEANFTLHVSVRAAGMASLGSSEIVGLSAALFVIILLVLMLVMFMLLRVKRQPYAESKTPNHLEVITNVNQHQQHQQQQQQQQQHHLTTNKTQQGNGNGGVVIANGSITNCLDNSNNNMNLERPTMSVNVNGENGVDKFMNPVQKPPRLTELPYSTSGYDSVGSILSTAPCFISPTASAGNNPDLINDTKRDEFGELKLPAILTTELNNDTTHAISGEYSRAVGCDSLYPSGLWHEHGTSSADDLFLKRYNDKTPIIESNQLYDLHERNINISSSNTNKNNNNNFSKTFPRTHYNNNNNSNNIQQQQQQNPTTSTAALLGSGSTNLSSIGGGSSSGGVSGYPNDYGLPLVPGAEQQQQQHNHLQRHPLHNHMQQQHHSPAGSSRGSPTPLPPTTHILPNGQPVNAKTIRVWQKGGVPVLPPVTALKRALISSSRNSPDEGYQEGCGTDV